MIEQEPLFYSVFQNSQIGLVIVNKDNTLKHVNNYMYKIFNLESTDVTGEMFGNVFSCTSVSNDQTAVCGARNNCSYCDLRKMLQYVFNNNAVIEDLVLNLKFNIQGMDENRWFKSSVSSICINNEVFAVISFVDITKQKQYEELLNYQLSLDLATGTLNKYSLVTFLKKFANGSYHYKNIIIGMIDFDNFKKINDTMGHLVGDNVLNIFCSVAKKQIRNQDLIGRFGGEEFMLIFSDLSLEEAVNTIKNIHSLFYEECKKEMEISVTFSVGLMEIHHEQRIQELEIIQEADYYLYNAKRNGKNRIVTPHEEILFEI